MSVPVNLGCKGGRVGERRVKRQTGRAGGEWCAGEIALEPQSRSMQHHKEYMATGGPMVT